MYQIRDRRRVVAMAFLVAALLGGNAGVWWSNWSSWSASPDTGAALADPHQAAALAPVQGRSAHSPTQPPGPRTGAPAGKPTSSEPTGAAGSKTPTADPSGPCHGADVHASPLVVQPLSLVLPAGSDTGTVTLHNCAAYEIHWSAYSESYVGFTATAGDLAGGAAYHLGFTVDTSGLEAGEVRFQIKLSQPGPHLYVDVRGTALGPATTTPSPSLSATW